jgi:hypothetical protein
MPKPGHQALFAVVCAAMLCVSVSAARAQAFFSSIEDLPVMPGLEEMPGTAVSFSKAEGRIAEVGAAGSVRRDAVLAFYRDTLPQLGWKETGEGRFAREDERLRLDFELVGARLIVRFSIAPG